MNAVEAAVLAVLVPGGLLSAPQIQRQAALPGWRTRCALAQLRRRGLVVADARRCRWQISECGRSSVAPKARRLM